MEENRETLKNRILYLAYKFRIREIIFLWDDKQFDPIIPEDKKILDMASLDVLKSMIYKYLEYSDILCKKEDDIIYKYHYKYKKST